MSALSFFGGAAWTLPDAARIGPAVMNGGTRLTYVVLLLVVECAFGQSLVGFDVAVASSSNVAGEFRAANALTAGSGYWCRRTAAAADHHVVRNSVMWRSAGDHDANQVVSWSGTMHNRHKAVGLRISWRGIVVRGTHSCAWFVCMM